MEAETLWQETVNVRRKLLGHEHPEVSMSVVSLGWMQRVLGKRDEAYASTSEALQMALKMEGPDSLDTAFDEDAYVLLLLDTGQPAEARRWIEKAMTVRMSKPAPSPSGLGESYDHLGQADLAEGKLATPVITCDMAFNCGETFTGSRAIPQRIAYFTLGSSSLQPIIRPRRSRTSGMPPPYTAYLRQGRSSSHGSDTRGHWPKPERAETQ